MIQRNIVYLLFTSSNSLLASDLLQLSLSLHSFLSFDPHPEASPDKKHKLPDDRAKFEKQNIQSSHTEVEEITSIVCQH